jgi:8-oxo-dGTP diphosphatase
MTNITKVGIGLAVYRENPEWTKPIQVLLGQRKGSHGEGEWSFPGGHLDYMEGFEDTAKRELVEEVGPQFIVEDFQVVSLINLTEYAPKHYIDIGMECWWVHGDPVVMEPEKCAGWEWFDIDKLPSPRFATIDRIMLGSKNHYTSGVTVWDKE